MSFSWFLLLLLLPPLFACYSFDFGFMQLLFCSLLLCIQFIHMQTSYFMHIRFIEEISDLHFWLYTVPNSFDVAKWKLERNWMNVGAKDNAFISQAMADFCIVNSWFAIAFTLIQQIVWVFHSKFKSENFVSGTIYIVTKTSSLN